MDPNIKTKLQDIEERNSDGEDTRESINTIVKENGKYKKLLTKNIQKIQDKMKRPNLRIIGIEEHKDLQLKGTVNVFKKL